MTLWALWFGLVSIGWERYAFFGIVMALILGGRVADHILTRWLGAPSTARALEAAAAEPVFQQGQYRLYRRPGCP